MKKKIIILVIFFVIFCNGKLFAIDQIEGSIGFTTGVNLSLIESVPSAFVTKMHMLDIGFTFAINNPRDTIQNLTFNAYKFPKTSKESKNRTKAIEDSNTIAERDEESVNLIPPKRINDRKIAPHDSWGGIFNLNFLYNAGETGIFVGQEFTTGMAFGFNMTADAIYSIEMSKNKYFFFVGMGLGFGMQFITEKDANSTIIPMSFRIPFGFRIFLDKHTEMFFQLTPLLSFKLGYESGYIYNNTVYTTKDLMSVGVGFESLVGFRFWPSKT